MILLDFMKNPHILIIIKNLMLRFVSYFLFVI